MVSLIAGCGVRWFLGVWHVYAVSCVGGSGCYSILPYFSAPALSVAIWVCSFNTAAAIPASSALFYGFVDENPPGIIVVILLHWRWYTPDPID